MFGSTFANRAGWYHLTPFDEGALSELARPFDLEGWALDHATLDALRVLSGGNPALANYGLENLWSAGQPSVALLEQSFEVFKQRHRAFVQDVRDAITHRDLSEVPQRVLDLVLRSSGGAVPQDRLREACAPREGNHVLPADDALQLLADAGLVELLGPVESDPVRVRPIASILNLPTPSRSLDAFDAQLQGDLFSVLSRMHRFGADFHTRQGVVEEMVFSAVIAVALGPMGWTVVRESIRGAGHADLTLTHRRMPGTALVEVKIWPRNDAREAHAQIAQYWTADVVRGAVVMWSDNVGSEWVKDYAAQCLLGTTFEAREAPDDVLAWWVVRSATPEGREVVVDHLLVRIPRRG